MKKCIFLLLAFMLLVSCRCGINHIFPSEYRLSKEKTFISHPTKIIIYEIRGDANIDSLKNYPTFCYDGCMIQKWVDFNNLNDADRDFIEAIIREIAVSLNKERRPSQELKTVLDNLSSLYFSGCYILRKAPGDKEYNFYEDFNLLDIKNKKMYRFVYMKGY